MEGNQIEVFTQDNPMEQQEQTTGDRRRDYWMSLWANLLNASPVDTGNMKAHILAYETENHFVIAVTAPYITNPKVGVKEIDGYTDYALEVNTKQPHAGWVNTQIKQTASLMGFESIMSKEDKKMLSKIKKKSSEESKMIRAFNMRKKIYREDIKSIKNNSSLSKSEKKSRIAKIQNLIDGLEAAKKPYESRKQIYKTKIEDITKKYDIPKKPKGKKGK